MEWVRMGWCGEGGFYVGLWVKNGDMSGVMGKER